jgi:ectoine hydroxylase-related dioxygenase (phytanoyl-CoA dioxygenase family)
MFNSILNKIFYIPDNCNINVDYIINESVQKEYLINGYVIIKNIASDIELGIIEDSYKYIQESTEQFENDFITSPNYGKRIQTNIQDQLANVNMTILPKIFNLDKCYNNFFSILVIKNKLRTKFLSAHQDISFVDEIIGCTTFLWIPIEDICEENGAITVLPKSHLWARWQKTHNRTISPLLRNNQFIMSKMKSLNMKRGDILIFDSSLIHGSFPNKSNKIRIAMNTAVCSNNTELVHYQNEYYNKSIVNKYFVDEYFWKEFKYTNPINSSQYNYDREAYIWNKQLTKLNLSILFNKFSNI